MRSFTIHGEMMLTDTGWFTILMAVVGFVAGAIASVSGFGIGSLLTPVLAIKTGTKLAVAAVSIPHMTATALRFWLMRIDEGRTSHGGGGSA